MSKTTSKLDRHFKESNSVVLDVYFHWLNISLRKDQTVLYIIVWLLCVYAFVCFVLCKRTKFYLHIIMLSQMRLTFAYIR